MAARCVRAVGWVLAAAAAGEVFAEEAAGSRANPQAVEEVKAGKRTAANAAWWGFAAEDSTAFLQAAIDSGAKTVVVPFVGAEWVIRPIRLRSNLELVFEPGVVVLARKGEFKGTGDSLFSAADARDITLRGYGATLRMHKKDYQSDAYKKAEWRMTLDFVGCRGVRVEGLRLESSGGDGIYLGATGKLPWCEDVVIRDVVCDDHHRQGISVIGAVNLLIENCVLSDTDGTAPRAGIDFEPNGPKEKLVNCVMRNCILENNFGAGVLIYLKNLGRETGPVSIRVENCHVRSGRDAGFAVGAVQDNGPDGLIEFVNCTVENTGRSGAYVYDKSADKVRVRFANCKWKNVATGDRTGGGASRPCVPILLTLRKPQVTKKHGGIEFVNCRVYDDADRPVLVAEDEGSGLGVHDLKGQIAVQNPRGARMDLRCKGEGVAVKIVEEK